MSGQQGYPISYKVSFHDPPISAEEVMAKERGACDALIVVSIVRPPDGSFSVLFYGCDGSQKKEVSPNDYFKVWTMMASNLSEMEGLSENKRSFAQLTFAAVQRALLQARDSGSKN